MISKEEIQTIYSDCRAILLLQDEEMLVQTLSSDFGSISNQNLDQIAIAVGFRDAARFLRASNYFHVFKKGERVMIKLADQNSVDKGKKKVIYCMNFI